MIQSLHSHIGHFWHFSTINQKQGVFDQFHNLSDLTQALKKQEDNLNLDLCLQHAHKIKEIIHSNSSSQSYVQDVDDFLETLTDWGMEQHPGRTMLLLSEIVSLDLLQKIMVFKQIDFSDIYEKAYLCKDFYPNPIDQSWTTRVYSEWKKCRPMVLYAIPNLINIFLGSFNFLDANKKYTTLWEKHLLLEIVFKLFIIPYYLIKILEPLFVVSVKVYAISAAIIFATGILITSYQRWLRPVPDEIANCTNLDKLMEKEQIEPKVGQAEDMQCLIAALEVGSNVLLIGNSGDGKTALSQHLIQKKHQKELPEKLQKLTFFEVDSGMIISNYSYGHSEVINHIKERVEGYEDNLLFIFDEFYAIATNPAAFQAFKKRFLEDKPNVRFMAGITFKEFEEIKKLDIDGSFRRRVVPIVLQSADDEQISLILREKILRIAKDLPIHDEAIDAIIKFSKKKDYLPGIGRPAKAIKMLMDAIGICRFVYDPQYFSIGYIEEQQKLDQLKLQAIQDIKINPDLLRDIKAKRLEIDNLKKDLKKNKNQVKRISYLISEKQKLSDDYGRITRLLAKTYEVRKKKRTIKDSLLQKDEILYLLYDFYCIEKMKNLLQKEIDKLRPHLPVQIDKALIEEVYKNFQDVEGSLFDDIDITTEAEDDPLDPPDVLDERKDLKDDEVLIDE